MVCNVVGYIVMSCVAACVFVLCNSVVCNVACYIVVSCVAARVFVVCNVVCYIVACNIVYSVYAEVRSSMCCKVARCVTVCVSTTCAGELQRISVCYGSANAKDDVFSFSDANSSCPVESVRVCVTLFFCVSVFVSLSFSNLSFFSL